VDKKQTTAGPTPLTYKHKKIKIIIIITIKYIKMLVTISTKDDTVPTWISDINEINSRLQSLTSVLYNIQTYWSSISFYLIVFCGMAVLNCPLLSLTIFVLLRLREYIVGLKIQVYWNKVVILRHTWSFFSRLGSVRSSGCLRSC
jgi:hypothetical protein